MLEVYSACVSDLGTVPSEGGAMRYEDEPAATEDPEEPTVVANVKQEAAILSEMTVKEEVEEEPVFQLSPEFPDTDAGSPNFQQELDPDQLFLTEEELSIGNLRQECDTSQTFLDSPGCPQDTLALSPGSQGSSVTRGRGRGRRRSRWKLKFHHQALPPEYLDHYEASMAQQDKTVRPVPPLAPRQCLAKMKPELNSPQPTLFGNLCTVDPSLFVPIQTLTIGDGEIFTRLQQGREDDSACEKKEGLLGSLLSSGGKFVPQDGGRCLADTEKKKRSSVIMSSGGGVARTPTPAPTTSRVMKYQDLPYMGEITLDNMKPRRGRKPKKADICHLIYKNYGTIFPGAPNQNALAETEEPSRRKQQEGLNANPGGSRVKKENLGIKCKPIDTLKSSPPLNHTDVQNRIISSLLEKRLTAASLDAKRIPASGGTLEHPRFCRPDPWNATNKRATTASEPSDEPLNLCIKDLNQLKIRLLRKHGNFYEPRSSAAISVKSEPNSSSEELDLQGSSKETTPRLSDDTESTSSRNQTPQSETNPPPFPVLPFANPSLLPTDAMGSGGYVYWPNAGMFVHPMALQSQLLYYQKMGAIPLVPMPPVDNSPTFLPPQNNLVPIPALSRAPHRTNNKPVVPRGFSTGGPAKPEMPSELTFPRMKRLAPLGGLPQTGGSTTKRKRSAIFIPPMPSENSSNPTTEVSICKFKFTGGAKPSLQEKKMLSVDSGGNFRYYSGTGDKSMRGYEFFPRESLQQSSASHVGSPSEHFLAAAAASSSSMGGGEKVVSVPEHSQTLGIPTTMTKEALKRELTEHNSKPGHHRMLLPGYKAETATVESPDPNRESPKRLVPSDEHLAPNQLVEDLKKKTESAPISAGQFVPPGQEGQLRLRRKRKTRKSLAREKLEQTFKEKGFLIQTQQLESAEGATYCKFRQLRKFTRYLFRSWKDYLPGNVREMSVAAGVAGGSSPSQPDLEGEFSSGASTPPPRPPTTEELSHENIS
uniref:Uncharacterized protein n=1 Tax=Timema monikensis TaxID=170555 RepID=A0A7R9E223_9NEOP|nr:unnamed protein product [Timema monikensis]